MRCSDIRKRAAMTPQELPDVVQEHLSHCEQCSCFVDSLLFAEQALGTIGPTDIPIGLGERLARHALSQPSPSHSFLAQLVRIARPFAAAAVVTAIVVFIVVGAVSEHGGDVQDTTQVQGELASVQDEFLLSSYALVGGE